MMKKWVIAVFCIAMCGCAAPSAKSRFLEAPVCDRTYAFVNESPADACKTIMRVLDEYDGRRNPDDWLTRVSVYCGVAHVSPEHTTDAVAASNTVLTILLRACQDPEPDCRVIGLRSLSSKHQGEIVLDPLLDNVDERLRAKLLKAASELKDPFDTTSNNGVQPTK